MVPSSRRAKSGGFNPDIATQRIVIFGKVIRRRLAWVGGGNLSQAYYSTTISGVYRVAPDRQSVVYIGESKDLRSRISTHSSNFEATWEYAALDRADHAQRLEIENDLIASHIAVVGAPPTRQFQN